MNNIDREKIDLIDLDAELEEDFDISNDNDSVTKDPLFSQRRIGLVSLVLGLVCLIPTFQNLNSFLSSSTSYPEDIYLPSREIDYLFFSLSPSQSALLDIITPFAFSIVFVILGIRTLQGKRDLPIEYLENGQIGASLLSLTFSLLLLFVGGPVNLFAIVFLTSTILIFQGKVTVTEGKT